VWCSAVVVVGSRLSTVAFLFFFSPFGRVPRLAMPGGKAAASSRSDALVRKHRLGDESPEICDARAPLACVVLSVRPRPPAVSLKVARLLQQQRVIGPPNHSCSSAMHLLPAA